MVGANRIRMPAVSSFRNKRPGLYSFEAVVIKALTDLVRANMHILIGQLSYYSSGAITLLVFLKNCDDLLFHCFVFSFGLISALLAPFIKTTAVDIEHFAYLLNGMFCTNGIGKCIHHCQFPRLKMDNAFFKISRSCSVRRSSTFKRSISLKDAVGNAGNEPLPFPGRTEDS